MHMPARELFKRIGASIGALAMCVVTFSGTLQSANADEDTAIQPKQAGLQSTTQQVDAQAAARDIVCTEGTVYSVSSGGQLRGITDGKVFDVGSSASGWNNQFNGLGIGSEGKTVYAYNRSDQYIYQYDVSNGTWSSKKPYSGYMSGFGGTLVAGAVDLGTGNYLFGGFDSNRRTQTFQLWEYNTDTKQISYKGYVDTTKGAGDSANGDMAFDAAGNLYIVRGSGSQTTVFSVTAANLAMASGGQITSSGSNSFSTTGNVNGVAFDASGKAYLGAGSTIESFNMPDWSNKTTVTNDLSSSTDLASCSSPATITLEKVVNGRVQSSDQFGLSLDDGSMNLGITTTEGTNNGVQDQRVGPQPTVRGKTISFSESAAETTDMSQYASTYWCRVDGGDAIKSGTGTSGTVTIPATGDAVLCQFTNSPLVAHVNVTKHLLDTSGNDAGVGKGWTMSTTVTPTSGTATTATLAPSGDLQTNDQGTASWSVNYDAAGSSATVHVSETQQEKYAFASGQCVVTDNNGVAGTAIAITSADGVDVPGIGPGETVDCSFTNRLQNASLTIVKVVEGEYGKFVGSADPDAFKLTATAEGVVTAFKSGVKQDVNPGTYAIGETQLPGYEQDGDVVCKDGNTDLQVNGSKVAIGNGQHVTCTVTNKDMAGSVSWLKVDGRGNALSGSVWALRGPDGATHEVADCTQEGKCGTGEFDDRDSAAGSFRLEGQHWGAYTLAESQAPAGYVLSGEVHSYSIAASALDYAFADAFVNTQRTPPTLPFTGGVSTDAYVIGGSMLMAVALGGGFVMRRRAMRNIH
jgi:hypothetical protein